MGTWGRQVLYIQLTPQRISIRLPRTGAMLSEAADIAIEHKGTSRVIAAVGHAASRLRGSAGVQVYSPFAHPRSIINHYEEAEALLCQLIKQALDTRWLAWAPIVVLHPLGQPEGGFTDVELRALRAMGLGAGARKVHVWTGRALHDDEVLHTPQACPQGQWH